MGQTSSKHAGTGMKEIARKRASTGPKTVKLSSSSSSSSSTTPATIVPKAFNPANFTRGQGPMRDIRDIEQEAYLKNIQNTASNGGRKDQATEMPPDLLKFIKDVGPLRQTVDKEFTSPRLLKEGQGELNNFELSRKPKRNKLQMPLMGGDEGFTTTRSTNFSHGNESDEQAYGIDNLDYYRLLKRKASDGDVASISDLFYTEKKSQEDDWSEQERKDCSQLLRQAMHAIDLPVLLQDSEGNYLGVHRDRVPGPEVKAVESIPESKVKLVLADVATRNQVAEKFTVRKAGVRRPST